MNQEQTDHMERIVARLSDRIKAKYQRGQAEHNDNLWQRPALRELVDEVTDMNTYLAVLEDQMRQMWATCALIRDALNEGRLADCEHLLDELDAGFREQLKSS